MTTSLCTSMHTPLYTHLYPSSHLRMLCAWRRGRYWHMRLRDWRAEARRPSAPRRQLRAAMWRWVGYYDVRHLCRPRELRGTHGCPAPYGASAFPYSVDQLTLTGRLDARLTELL